MSPPTERIPCCTSHFHGYGVAGEWTTNASLEWCNLTKGLVQYMNVLEHEGKAEDFYQRLRAKIRKQLTKRGDGESGKGATYDKFVEMLAILPDFFHLAIKCLFDKTIPVENKGALVLAVAYVVSPIDLVPDFIFITGWLDDLIVLTMGLNKFLDVNNFAIKQAVTRHWAGEGEVLDTVKHVLATGDAAVDFLPKRFLQTVRGMFAS